MQVQRCHVVPTRKRLLPSALGRGGGAKWGEGRGEVRASGFIRRADSPHANLTFRVQGEIIYLDRFGNAITNIEAGLLPGDVKGTCEVTVKRKVRCKLAECYSAVPAGHPVAVIGSSGLLEIAVNGGSAERRFRLKIGDKVMAERE